MKTKSCQNCSQDFIITNEDLTFYKKMKVPEPTYCLDCRMQRRFAFRGEKHLYHDQCDLCGKKMLSVFSDDKPNTVYCTECWWSDTPRAFPSGRKLDACQYGIDFDFNTPFFEQIDFLLKKVPLFNVFNTNSENSDYTNYAPFNKNCYLVFGGWKNEDTLYSDTPLSCKNASDLFCCEEAEIGYEQIDSNYNYHSAFLQNCEHCSDSYFLFDCHQCKNCIGCFNLRQKEYHIFNKPCTKEEYEKLKNSFTSRKSLNEFRKKFDAMVKNKAIHLYMIGTKNENVSGNLIFNSKNIRNAFSVYDSEDIVYGYKVASQKNSTDGDGIGEGELVYDSISNDYAYNTKFISTALHLKECEYCLYCYNSSYLFGCVGMNKKKYCILNKQYTEEEYKTLISKIIEYMWKNKEYGEFFPVKISPFGYNETQAQEYFPIKKEEVIKKGWKWHDESGHTRHGVYPQDYNIPDNINDVTDDITKQIVSCVTCHKEYRIIPQELDLYRKLGLPIPNKCFHCRHKDRFSKRLPLKLWQRKCDKCGKEIESSYSPERTEKVYCESCYFEKMY